MRVVLSVVALAASAAGCATPADPRPLTAVEQDRAWKCDRLIGVSRLACIQQTAGRPGSPYDAGNRVVPRT